MGTRARKTTLRVVCLQKETGELVWEILTEGAVDTTLPIVLIYINDEKNMYCLRTNGELIWKKELEWVMFSSTSLGEERLFVGAEQGFSFFNKRCKRNSHSIMKSLRDIAQKKSTREISETSKEKIVCPVCKKENCLPHKKKSKLSTT